MRIATWTVRSLHASGKLDNTILEMERMKINILGISDVQWPGSGKCNTSSGVLMYYSGTQDPKYRYGVGFLLQDDNEVSAGICTNFRSSYTTEA